MKKMTVRVEGGEGRSRGGGEGRSRGGEEWVKFSTSNHLEKCEGMEGERWRVVEGGSSLEFPSHTEAA